MVGKDKVLAHLDALKDDAAAHIWPDDLERCMTSECAVQVASVRMGSPDGMTVPLFSREQVVEALEASKQEAQGAVAVVATVKERVGFGRIEPRKSVQFLQDVPVGTVLFAATPATPAQAEQVLENAARSFGYEFGVVFPGRRTPDVPYAGPMGYEKYSAIRQGHCNAAVETYFEARPHMDGDDERKAFEAGHTRGFDGGYDAASPPAPQPKRWAQCPETDTPCSVCPTEGKPCEAAQAEQKPQGEPFKKCGQCDTPGACREYGGGYCPTIPQAERVALTPQEIVHAGWSGRKYAQGTKEGRAFLYGALFAQEYHGIGTSATKEGP